MVDDIVNQVVGNDKPGFVLPLLLFGGFRALIDDLHAELAGEGYSDFRPAHGFALQAIGRGGVTASELGRRLGISKQAAGKTVDRLVRLGFAERHDDESDGRRKVIRLTRRGVDVLARSAEIFDRLRAQWARKLGRKRLREVEDALSIVVPPGAFKLDVAGWLEG